ncbi:MAG: sensor histidine kinase, partial [Rhodospirillales bacterium]
MRAAVAAAASLRNVLVVAFTLIATIPVLILGAWVESSALRKELDSVKEKHLLLAKNLTGSLSRYARDLESTFLMATGVLANGQDRAGLAALLADLNFEHMCLVEADGRVSAFLPVRADVKAPDAPLSADMMRAMRSIADGSGKPAFSNVIAGPGGRPTIYLVRLLPEGRVAFGALATDYIREVQRAIAFGAQGHAAIFDRAGNFLAHPNPALWQARTNLSKLPVVQRMMAGETGVATFHSPAMKADMVAGYTAVPRTGWGVMVPQPMSELIARANDVRNVALLIIVLGLGSVGVVSWFLAKRLTLPVQAAVAAARDLAAGNLEARVGKLRRLVPSELRSLAHAFNHMAGEVSRKNSALAEAAGRAEAANRTKSAFLANMSHELRTPLNAILGFSEMIRSKAFGALAPRYEGYAGDIHASGLHLLAMINEILDFTKVDAGVVSIEVGEVDVPGAVDSAVRMIQPLADAKNLRLQTAFEPDLPALLSDGTRVRQVLLNLLSNAVKFTPDGGRIKVAAAPEPGGGVRMVVSDTGIGIALDDIPVVMAPFGQAASALIAQKDRGTGLGLPLTRRLVELMDGRFEIKSAPGQGTAVTVVLPSLVAK